MKGLIFFNKDGSSSRLRHSGVDVLDLLQRLTTADLNGMSPGESRRTALLTERGRIVDAFLVAMEATSSFLLMSDMVDAAPLIASIDKYTIVEDATIQDVSSETTQTVVIGENAEKVAKEVAKATAGCAFSTGREQLEAWEVVSPKSCAEYVTGLLEKYGENMSASAFETLRVELGIPFTGSELDERSNPLEAGLEDIVSFDKGCYIGQEVVARLDTYEKVQRKLMGLMSDSPLTEGSALHSEGASPVGRICSAVHSKNFGHIALGFVRSNWAAHGTALTTPEGSKCVVRRLPFSG